MDMVSPSHQIVDADVKRAETSTEASGRTHEVEKIGNRCAASRCRNEHSPPRQTAV